MDRSNKVTEILCEWGDGNVEVLEELMPLVYDELHRQAARFLRNERAGHTLQTTALIHETYLKLIDQRSVGWVNRQHFFAICARLMRRVLVDHARAKHRDKRGGNIENLPLDESISIIADGVQKTDLLALDAALDRLAAVDEQQARIVELRYFSGLSLEETAEAMKVSRTTVATDWSMAKAWLYREMTR